jgi:hypothetical protein
LSMNASIGTNNATIALQGPGASFSAISFLGSNQGSFSVLGGLTFTTAGSFTNTGSLTLAPSSKLVVSGSFTQIGSGSVSVQITGSPGSGQYGAIAAQGSTSLAGTLNVSLLNGFVPSGGAAYAVVVTFSSASGTFGTVNGLKIGPVTFFSIGYPGTGATLTAQTVSAGTATHFVITCASSTTAGVPYTFTVIAEDAFGNPATGYGGTVHFNSSDNSAQLPSASTLSSGQGVFHATLDTAGSQTLTASDTAGANSITGSSAPITVIPAAPQFLSVVKTPGLLIAGTGFSFSVLAKDAFGNIATSYNGTVQFNSTDTQAVLPINSTLNLTSGTGLFGAVLRTAGSQDIMASDSAQGFIFGSSFITVIAAPAAQFALTVPAAATAGVQFAITVMAQDPFHNFVPGYSGTVHFSSSDSIANLPANTTLAGGIGTFSATLNTAGFQVLSASDLATSSISGASNQITVSPTTATHFLVQTGANETAGSAVNLTVTAEDRFNNMATSYGGSVQFSTSDVRYFLPASSTLTSGIGAFSATLLTAGSQTLIATDTASSSVTGASNAVAVVPSTITHFAVNTVAFAISGNAFSVTLKAKDAFNNTVTNYTGTVQVYSSDTAATLPAPQTLTSGVGTFSATLRTNGSETLVAFDNLNIQIAGVTTVSVTRPASHFLVSALPTATAGTSFVFQVTALDSQNLTAAGYTGTVHFTSTDSQASLPANTTLSNGVGLFAAVLKTAGAQTLFATDTTFSTITGASGSILVSGLAATRFTVTTAPLPTYPSIPAAYPTVPGASTTFASTGAPVVFTVVATDPFGNIDQNYHGTVSFSTSDTGAGVVLPVNSTLAAGVGTFSATFATFGNQFLTATDTASSSITGTSSAVLLRGLVVTSFAATPSGFVVSFNKPFNPNTVIMYTTGSTPDDIILTTTNSQVSVRGSTLFNANDTSLTFVRTNSISSAGTFNPSSGLLAAGNYTLTLRSLTTSGNGFQDALGTALDGTDTGHTANYLITFSVTAPPVAVGIPDFARGPSNTDAVFLPSTLSNGSTFALSYTNPLTHPTTGTATITFSTTAATLQSNIQNALTFGGLATQVGQNPSASNTANSVVIVTTDSATGANVLVTFQSALATTTNQLLSSNTTGVSIALATINAAQNVPSDGIPIALSSGLNVTSGSFTLQYNPALLTVSGAVSKVAGASFTLVSNNTSTGTLVLSLSSPTRLTTTATAITMGSLLATVPLSATSSYGVQQLLHFSSEQLNGTAGPITVTNADGLEVAAYFGDVTGLGAPLSLGDATAISSVANSIANTITQTIPGFGAYPTLDPAIIGDVSLQGSVTSTDAGAMTQQVGGSARITIPYPPVGLTTSPVPPGAMLLVNSEDRAVVTPRPTSLIVPAGIPAVQASPSIRDLAALQNATSGGQLHAFSSGQSATLSLKSGSNVFAPTVDLFVGGTSAGVDKDSLDAVFADESDRGCFFWM